MTRTLQQYDQVSAPEAHARLMRMADKSGEAQHYLTIIEQEWNTLLNTLDDREQHIIGIHRTMQELIAQRDSIAQELLSRIDAANDQAFHELAVQISNEHGINPVAAAWVLDQMRGGSRFGITITAKSALDRAMKELSTALDIAGVDADDFLDIERMAEVLLMKAAGE